RRNTEKKERNAEGAEKRRGEADWTKEARAEAAGRGDVRPLRPDGPTSLSSPGRNPSTESPLRLSPPSFSAFLCSLCDLRVPAFLPLRSPHAPFPPTPRPPPAAPCSTPIASAAGAAGRSAGSGP